MQLYFFFVSEISDTTTMIIVAKYSYEITSVPGTGRKTLSTVRYHNRDLQETQ